MPIVARELQRPLPGPLAIRRTGNVPLEYIGRARLYRSKIATANAVAEPEVERLLAPFRPRPGFVPWPRHTMLRSLARRWGALPRGNRFPSAAKRCCDVGKIELADLWLKPSRLLQPGWSDNELAITLSLRIVSIEPPSFSDESLIVAQIGLHALARRYERGADRTEAAVLNDLLGLAPGYVATFGDPDEIEDGDDFAIPAPAGGGFWIGAASQTGTAPKLLVRTFIQDAS
jgi:hypothetical protein